MFLKVLKPNSSRLCEATKILSFWLLKDPKVICQCRPYHSGKQLTSPLARDVILEKKKCLFRFSKLYSTSTELKNPCKQDESEENAEDFYKKHNIIINGDKIPQPILNIDEAHFPDHVKIVLKKNNVITPTPIQATAWSAILEGKDFIGISPTGSGKTLGYGVPAVLRAKCCQREQKSSIAAPCTLVLAPTRELAKQIAEVLNWFPPRVAKTVVVYGGEKYERQKINLRQGADILIATPGRCIDFLETGYFTLNNCSFFVLDEADRMLDMGFLKDIKRIISQLPANRQNVMWSATWPLEVREIASEFLNKDKYIQVFVGSPELEPNKNVKQTIIFCENNREKFQKLIDLLTELRKLGHSKILVFAERKFDVENLSYQLTSNGFSAVSIHSGKKQNHRELMLRRFRSGTINILVATAVAARGLDVDNITHVVNFDCPKSGDEYIHKIGRTGRMEKIGEAITYVTPEDETAGYLIKMLKGSNKEIPKELFRLKSQLSSFNEIYKQRKRRYFNPNQRYQYTRRGDFRG